MITRRSTLAVFAAAVGAPRAFAQQPPPGYPADYADTVAKAKAEGKVAIYTSTDLGQAQKLLDGFKAAFPGIAPEWNDLGTTSAFNRVVSEAAAKQVGGDIAWTSALDLQLTRAEVSELDAAFARLTVHGGRMSEQHMRIVEQ